MGRTDKGIKKEERLTGTRCPAQSPVPVFQRPVTRRSRRAHGVRGAVFRHTAIILAILSSQTMRHRKIVSSPT